MPKEFTYDRLYTCTKVSPYCIYAFRHNFWITASSLIEKDRIKFLFDYVVNTCIFQNYETMLKNKKAKAENLREQLRLDSVVPIQHVNNLISNFKEKVNATCDAALMGSHNRCEVVV